jgi:hypothetical protein
MAAPRKPTPCLFTEICDVEPRVIQWAAAPKPYLKTAVPAVTSEYTLPSRALACVCVPVRRVDDPTSRSDGVLRTSPGSDSIWSASSVVSWFANRSACKRAMFSRTATALALY